MPNLSEDLLNKLVRVKRELYPCLEESLKLNESALMASVNLNLAWKYIEQAVTIINDRGKS